MMADVSMEVPENRQLLTYPNSGHCLEKFSYPSGLASRRRHLVPDTSSDSTEGGHRKAAFPPAGDVGKWYV